MISFWHDIWVGVDSLKTLYLELYVILAEREARRGIMLDIGT